jgi:NitT/TauT family transport system ATP-binding protein
MTYSITLTKRFGEHVIFQDKHVEIQQAAVTTIVGPSGCGKTTLLRMLMGFEDPDDSDIASLSGLRLSAVFQEDRLCENLSALSNIRLVCPDKGRILSALDAVGLTGSLKQPVRVFSGGMKRRVALVRSLLAPYDLLLLDEPFKGLDQETKDQVIAFTRKMVAGKTVLLVTHDEREAQLMGSVSTVTLP